MERCFELEKIKTIKCNIRFQEKGFKNTDEIYVNIEPWERALDVLSKLVAAGKIGAKCVSSK